MFSGSDLKEWRRRNGYTQDMLRLALGLRSRQTIITWENSDEPLSKMIQLALLALEFLPEKCINVSSARFAGFAPTRPRERDPSYQQAKRSP